MKYDNLLELARTKATEAQAELEKEEPDVEKANGLLAEAEGFRDRAEKMAKAMKIADEAKPSPSGIVVTADEEDKAKAAKTWSIGEFFQAMALRPETVRAYRSKDVPEHYDLTEAIGQKAVGSLYEARQKALGMKQLGLNETVGPQGGFLVGQDHSYDIMSRVYNVGDLLRLVNIVGLGPNSNGMTFLRDSETSRALGNRRGGVRHYWLAEGGTKHASYPQFERFEMQLNKLAVLVYSTDELLQDATALESYIMEVAPEEIRFAVEDSIIRGTGAGQPQGILGAPCLVTVAAEIGQAVDTVVSENVINMWSRRWAGVKDYVWLVNQDVTPQLIQMNLGAGVGGGALTYMPPGGLSGLPYGTLFGRPVIESEYADTVGDVGDIILMAPSQYKMIDKGGVQQASSIHVAFLTDETVFRFVYRVDGEPSWAAPLTPYLSALTQSPFVALAAR